MSIELRIDAAATRREPLRGGSRPFCRVTAPRSWRASQTAGQKCHRFRHAPFNRPQSDPQMLGNLLDTINSRDRANTKTGPSFLGHLADRRPAARPLTLIGRGEPVPALGSCV